mmetsp:Transcript_1989/g.6628  ORF Transcript_1989/g.6628 Transcript_1989/m.6628 type:complete len:217 (-) Transcript_1989:290-940(-)
MAHAVDWVEADQPLDEVRQRSALPRTDLNCLAEALGYSLGWNVGLGAGCGSFNVIAVQPPRQDPERVQVRLLAMLVPRHDLRRLKPRSPVLDSSWTRGPADARQAEVRQVRGGVPAPHSIQKHVIRLHVPVQDRSVRAELRVHVHEARVDFLCPLPKADAVRLRVVQFNGVCQIGRVSVHHDGEPARPLGVGVARPVEIVNHRQVWGIPVPEELVH